MAFWNELSQDNLGRTQKIRDVVFCNEFKIQIGHFHNTKSSVAPPSTLSNGYWELFPRG